MFDTIRKQEKNTQIFHLILFDIEKIAAHR